MLSDANKNGRLYACVWAISCKRLSNHLWDTYNWNHLIFSTLSEWLFVRQNIYWIHIYARLCVYVLLCHLHVMGLSRYVLCCKDSSSYTFSSRWRIRAMMCSLIDPLCTQTSSTITDCAQRLESDVPWWCTRYQSRKRGGVSDSSNQWGKGVFTVLLQSVH